MLKNLGTLFAVTVVTYMTKNNNLYIFYSDNQSSSYVSNVAGSLDNLTSIPCGKEHFWYPQVTWSMGVFNFSFRGNKDGAWIWPLISVSPRAKNEKQQRLHSPWVLVAWCLIKYWSRFTCDLSTGTPSLITLTFSRQLSSSSSFPAILLL
jgi:hypothetical protein